MIIHVNFRIIFFPFFLGIENSKKCKKKYFFKKRKFQCKIFDFRVLFIFTRKFEVARILSLNYIYIALKIT